MTDEMADAKQRADALLEKLTRQAADLKNHDELRERVRQVVDALERVSQNLNETKPKESERTS